VNASHLGRTAARRMHDRDLRLAAILRRIGGNRHHDGFLLALLDGDHSAVATVEYGGFAAKLSL